MGKRKIGISLFFLTLITLLASSCNYTKYAYLNYNMCMNPVWDSSGTKVVFAVMTSAYKRPVGLSRFPDGGMCLTVYSGLELCYYDFNDSVLTKLTNFNDLSSRSFAKNNFDIKVAFNDSMVYYKIDLLNKWFSDSLKAKYMKYYSLNLYTKNISEINKTCFDSMYSKISNPYKDNVSDGLKKILNLTMYDRGIDIRKIYPLSDKDYLDYIVLRKGNKDMRDAIIEQIFLRLPKQRKMAIIDKMKDRKQKLLSDYLNTNDGLEKKAKKSSYLDYLKFLKRLKMILGLPVINSKIADSNEVIKDLKKFKIDIPDDFEFSYVNIFDHDYDAELKLKIADSTNIRKYIKWFRSIVVSLLNNQWRLSELTKNEKPNKLGIVVDDEVNFIWEHTKLYYKQKGRKCFLFLDISYDENRKKFLKFLVSKEIEPRRLSFF